jgi:FMN phosphatase YigB (HAD superfamily)
MIKLVIFDIDNTIMDFPKNFEIEFKKVLDKFGSNVEAKELYKAVGTYEINKEGVYYTKEKLLEVVNKVLNLNLPIDFIDEFFNMYNVLISEIDASVIDTLKYLKTKYKVVALSNWFTDSQRSRLKKAGVLNCFDEVYGTDIVPMKPRVESFMSVIGNLKP